ncbi:Hypoxia up-regulated protein 1 (Fragment) [Seminavis robusta]|uniref:Hypoxia up-regulated protein 1 n=1 Tax=Seminavis robusta TaxID=568900 RepID=A0A9N8HZR4_9STRA
MSVVGVDFGLANSVIAAAGRGGVDVILNGNSNRLNPSMVGFDQCRKMGEEAQTGASSNYKNTIKHMKRLVGLSFDDPTAQAEIKKWIPFNCVPIKHPSGGPDSIGVKVSLNGEDHTVSIEAVAGMMLKHMGMIAASKASEASDHVTDLTKFFPQDWVIAIPAYFTDSQRRGLQVGCEIAGIQVQRLMHENTATALAYGIFKDLRKEFTKDKPTNIMFIDMGASAFTVSVAAFEPGKLIVKSSHFDADLGGRDFDLVIAEWIAKQFQDKYKGKLSADPMSKPKVRLKLMAAAEKAKKTLSPHGVKEARINLECLMDDFDFSTSLKAPDYESMCAPLLARLAAPIEKALAETGLAASELASVEIVGGSTRIGCIKRELTKLLDGQTLSTTMNADEAVARGAALQSAILSPRFKVLPYEIQESQPYPIKISWDQQAGVEEDADATNSVVMFDRGLNFPIVRRVTLKRAGDFTVSSAYDDSALQYGLPTGAPRDIATFGIKLASDGEKKVRVNVKQDIHGVVHLSSAQMVEEVEEGEDAPAEAEAPKEGEEAPAEKKKKVKKTNLEFTQSRPLDWSKDLINKAYEEEVSMANIDRIVKETSDMRNELESYIYDMRDKISSSSQLADYATDEEKAAFTTKQETIENWLYEDGFDATKSVYAEKLAELKQLGGPIETRSVEASGRPGALSALQANLERYKQWVNQSQTDAKYAHITDEERGTCHAKCDEVSAWMYDLMDKQGGLPMSADPVLKVGDINYKSRDLNNVCSPIMRKPVPKKEEPKPAPEPEKKEAEPETMEGVEPEGAKDGDKPDAPEDKMEE